MCGKVTKGAANGSVPKGLGSFNAYGGEGPGKEEVETQGKAWDPMAGPAQEGEDTKRVDPRMLRSRLRRHS